MTVEFVVIGAQKAATTSLHAALSTVPGVYMPPGERAFWEDPDFYERKWEAFGVGRHERVKGVKRPDILCRPELRSRVVESLPEARFIAVLRDPISRAVSAYFHLVRHAHLPHVGLDVALERSIASFGTGVHSEFASLIEYGLYGKHLEAWYQMVPPERLLVLPQSAIRVNLESALRSCCMHLGVEISARGLGEVPRANENSGIYDDRWIRWLRLAHRVKTRPLEGGGSRRVPRALPLKSVGVGMTAIGERLAKGDAAIMKPSTSTLTALQDIFREDSAILERLVGPELMDWDPQFPQMNPDRGSM